MKIGEIACRKVKTLNFTEPVARALFIMQEENVRHLPVVKNRVPAGMVSDHNILKHIGWQGEASKHAAINDRVEKIMRQPIVTTSPDETTINVAKLIVSKNIGAVPLIDSSECLVGIATKSDFLKCYTHKSKFVGIGNAEIPVSDIMSRNLLSVAPDSSTKDALQLMKQKRIQHLPVLREQKLVGMLSDKDILRGKPDSSSRTRSVRSLASPLHVRGLMSPSVETLTSGAPLHQAAQRMLETRMGAMPVVEGGLVVGIVTETDLLKIVSGPIEANKRMFKFAT